MTDEQYEQMLEDAWKDQQRLEPLERRDDLGTLRRVWVSVHGKAPLRVVPADQAFDAVMRFGCSARDDDSFTLWLIRNGKLVTREYHDNRTPPRQIETAMRLRSGDTLIGLHSHICATDCTAGAAQFLHGVQVA